MKLGCASWCFAGGVHIDTEYEKVISTIAELGFEGVELIAFTEKFLSEYYTKKKIRELVELMESQNLTLSEFVVYHEIIDGLVSFDREEKKKSLERFKNGVQIAKELGTKIVNTVSHWPKGLEAPNWYLSAYIHPYAYGVKYFDTKLRMKMPPNFNWEKIWENYVDSIGSCADIANDAGLLFALEGHTHTIVCHTDSFLRLFKEVNSNALGMNFDTSWQFMQREYLPMSIYKLGKKVFHVHTRDSDGQVSYMLPPGQGIIDWEGFIKALKNVGYNGFLSIELGGYSDMKKVVTEGKNYLEGILKKINM